MQTRSTTQSRRHTALVLLLVWLFAIGSAWVNACLLQEQHGGWQESSGSAASQTVQAVRFLPGHTGVDLGHPEEADAAKHACLKFCDDGSQLIVKQTPSPDLASAAMAVVLVLAWVFPLGAAAQHATWPALATPRVGAPLRTLFSRLAL